MRTQYPMPTFAITYDYRILDSTFIHAVHLAARRGNDGYMLGVSFQSDENTINWYDVKDPIGIYKRMVDPKKSPGFTFNNSVKNKKYSAIKVNDNPIKRVVDAPDRAVLKVDAGNATPDIAKKMVEDYKQKIMNKPPVIEFQSSYGPLLDTCGNLKGSSCINYLALGFNRATKGFVIYYALKSKIQDVYAVETMDATLYPEWIAQDSLGKYFNQVIKKLKPVLLRNRAWAASRP